MIRLFSLAAGAVLAVGTAAVQAATVTDLVGDKDCFGIPSCSGTPVPADGLHWVSDLGGSFFTDYRDVAAPPSA